MKKTLVVILTALALAGCDTSGGGDGIGGGNSNRTYGKELWGEWLRMDTGDKWYISDRAVKINDAETPLNATLTKQSERVIEVADGSRKYYLYASRIATARFTGAIVTDTDATGSGRAISGGLGGIHITIANLVNTANELSAVTDGEGKFTAEGVIVGDAYKLTLEGGASVTVIPTSNGDDIGVVAITSGVNFKTSLTPAQSEQSAADMTELYVNETYQFNLEFENTGDEDCPAPMYAITAPSGVTITGNLQGILGTIEPGVKKNVPIGVRCSAVAGDYEYKKINVTIRDGTGKTWEDSVSLRFYKETLDFTIKAEKPVSGIVIAPDAKTYSFTEVMDGVVSAPRRTTGDYLVVFSGATIETETRYALGVGVEADGDFGGFFDTARYEPNNTEGAAVALNTQKVMAFLYKNDIDYYRVSYGEFNLPPAPTNVSAGAVDTEVTVSWDAVDGASSYNVYRADSQTGTYTKVGASATASYTETVASVGTYYYAVSAVGASGFESARSAPTAATVTGPAVPTDMSASAADDQVTVSWDAVDGASSYNVYRADSQTGTYTKVGASTSPPYIETVAATGTYYYAVSAVGASGFESAHSASTAVTVTGPSVPTGITASAMDDQVTVSWAAVTGASSYNVYRADSQTGTYTKVGASATASYTETVSSVGTYYYAVSAVGASSFESARSAPTAVTVTALTREIDVANLSETLSWLAVNAVSSTRYTLLLGRDESIPSQNLSYSSTNITITLKGKGGERIVSLSDNEWLFRVGDGVTLILDSGVTLKGHSDNTQSLVVVNSGGNLVLEDGGEISGNSASVGGGVSVGGGMFTMNGGAISGNSASVGGGVYVSGGTFTMNGGEISGNTGEGVYVSGGTFTMNGGAISGNSASVGGGVDVSSSGTFTMSGGEISGNTASFYGGGVDVSSSGAFTMSGGEISGNSAGFYGGGVAVSGGAFTMSGGTISGNTASYGGGGVYVSNGMFTKQAGGIIYGSNASSALSNTVANGRGHTVYVSDSQSRDTTAGAGVTLDSAKDGSAGGWE
ncbi:MAG: hypothetical protein LBK73_06550 [Treponema sp.]|nr:hypothetical protein [Treponema sp.]